MMEQFLPFRLLRKAWESLWACRNIIPPPSSFIPAFSLLLTASCLLLLTSCKSTITPPEDHSSGPDTTSHNFFWTAETLGAQGTLYDVAIVNDNLAYAVGEIYQRDSMGQLDPTRYNLAKWNGTNWDISRLQFPQYNYDCTIAFYSPGPIRSVLAFSANSVLFTDGLSVVRWNGSAFVHYPCVSLPIIGNGRFTKIWGISDGDFYCVGTEGTIFHYSNSTWQRIEAGTSVDFHDVIGGVARRLPTVATASSPGETRVVKLSPQSVDSISWSSAIRLRTACVTDDGSIFVGGDGIWKRVWPVWVRDSTLPAFFYTSMRGSKSNDLVAVSWSGVVIHYNGQSWHQYIEVPSWMNFESVVISKNLIIAVGFTGGLWADKGAVLIGRRIQ